MTSRKELILGAVSDLALDFVAYDRKDDEELPLNSIEEALEDGEITIDEIVVAFMKGLLENVQDSLPWRDSEVQCSQCGVTAVQWTELRKDFVTYRCTNCGHTYDSGLNGQPVR